MAYSIGPVLAIQGEKSYQQAMKGIRESMQYVKAEANAVTSAFDKNDNSVAALTAKNKALTGAYDLQKKSVNEAKAALERMESEGISPTSAAYQRMNANLNNAQGELNKTTNELKQNENAIKQVNDQAKSDRIEKFSASMKNMGDIAGKAVVIGIKAAGAAMVAIGVAAAAAAAAVWKMGKDAGNAADELLTLSAQTGLSVGTLQEMQYAARFVDVEVEDLAKGMAKTVMAMRESTVAGKDYIEAAGGITISMKDASGATKSTEQVFYETVDALSAMTDETMREIAAQDLFGRSYQDLMPLIQAGTGALAMYAEEARKMGLVLSDEMVTKLGQFDDVMERTEAQMSGLGKQLAVIFLPALQKVGTGISEFLSLVSDSLSDGFQAGDIKKIGGWLSEKLIEGMKSISKYIPEVVSVLTETLTEAIRIIVTLLPQMLPILLDGAMQLINGLLTAITENATALGEMVVTLIMMIVTFMAENLPLIVSAATQIIIAIVQGLTQAMPQLIPATIDAITTIISGLIDNVDLLIPAAFEMIVAIVAGIIMNLPKILEAAVQIVVKVGEGIWSALTKLDDAIKGIITQVATGIANFIGDVVEAGKDIVRGIWEGMQSMGAWLGEKFKGLFKGNIEGAKDYLGIRSPSKVYAEIGENMAAGLGVGFGAEMKKVSKMINTSIPTEVNIGMNGINGRSVGRGNITNNFYVREMTKAQTDYFITQVDLRLGARLA